MSPGTRKSNRNATRCDNHRRIVNAYQMYLYENLKDYEYLGRHFKQMWMINYVTHPRITFVLLKLFCVRHDITQSVAFDFDNVAKFIEDVTEKEVLEYFINNNIDVQADGFTATAQFLSECFSFTTHSGIAAFVSKCATMAPPADYCPMTPPSMSEEDLWNMVEEEDAAALLRNDEDTSLSVEETVTQEVSPESPKLCQHTFEEAEPFETPVPLTSEERHEDLVERVVATTEPELIVYAPPFSGKSTIIEELRAKEIPVFDTDDVLTWKSKPKIIFTNIPSIVKYAKNAYSFMPSRNEFEARCRARQLDYSSGWYDDALTWSQTVNCCYSDRKLDLKSRFYFYHPVRLKD